MYVRKPFVALPPNRKGHRQPRRFVVVDENSFSHREIKYDLVKANIVVDQKGFCLAFLVTLSRGKDQNEVCVRNRFPKLFYTREQFVSTVNIAIMFDKGTIEIENPCFG